MSKKNDLARRRRDYQVNLAIAKQEEEKHAKRLQKREKKLASMRVDDSQPIPSVDVNKMLNRKLSKQKSDAKRIRQRIKKRIRNMSKNAVKAENAILLA